MSVDCFADLNRELEAAKQRGESSLIEVKCSIDARDDFGRPTITALENKHNVMKYIQELQAPKGRKRYEKLIV